MALDKKHPLVGKMVIYDPGYHNAVPEHGTVTGVNKEGNIVFVRYGKMGIGSKATPPYKLKFPDGSKVEI